MTEQPGYTPEHVVHGLSLRRRLAYVTAGLGGLAGAAMIGLMWATEPVALPARTQLAFTTLILTGVAWAGCAAWALARRPLFALDRVIAAALAVGVSALTTIGAVAITLTRANNPSALAAAGVGLTLVAIAGAALARARAYRANLLTQQRELEADARPSAATGDNPDSPTSQGVVMKARRPPPLGPLALAMRHSRSATTNRRIALLALVLGITLITGIVLLAR